MSTLNPLPVVALMTVSKSRRKKLLQLALPAMVGIPAAQAGALAVVSADSIARREANVATAEATSAVTAVLSAAVEHGAELSKDDLAHIPLASTVVAQNPDILRPTSLEGASQADIRRAIAVLENALTSSDGQTNGQSAGQAAGQTDGGAKTAGDSRTQAAAGAGSGDSKTGAKA